MFSLRSAPILQGKSASNKSRPHRSLSLRAGVIVVLCAAIVSGCAQDSGNDTDVVNQGYQSGDGSVRVWEEHERIESVELVGTDFEGEPVDTKAMLGNVVVLNTWYAACPPCRAEAADLLDVATEREADGVKFLGINRTDDAGTALAFEREFGITWPSIDDASGKAVATLAGIVPIKAVPTTLVLDTQGKVAARVLGQVDKSTLNSLIDDVLAVDNDAETGSE